MSELKLCSYCKSVPQANTWTLHGISETRYFCPNPDCPHSVRTVTLEQWNTRPIEDALNARIAELEEKQRWRVVADGELPEVYRDEDGDFIPFLVCEGDGDYPFTARYDGINWRAGIFVPDITHWMPLPESPIVYGKVCEE